jgi:hypothetical protein
VRAPPAILCPVVLAACGAAPPPPVPPAAPPGTITVRVQGAFAWPHDVERVLVAVDGALVDPGAAVPAAHGEHTLTVRVEAAYPSRPGGDERAVVRRAHTFETDTRAAVVTVRLRPGELLDPLRRFDVRFDEAGTVTPAERVARAARHPRVRGPLPAPRDCTRVVGPKRRLCEVTTRFRQVRVAGDVVTAACLGEVLDAIDAVRAGRARVPADVLVAQAEMCWSYGCTFPAPEPTLPACADDPLPDDPLAP